MPSRCVNLILALLVAAAGAGGTVAQDLRLKSPLPVKPVVIAGEVSVIAGNSGSPVISPWFKVTRGTEPVSNLVIALNGHELRETMPGQYAGIRITSIMPRPGMKLTFTIDFPEKPTPAIGFASTARVMGTATIGSMAAIIQPSNKSSLSKKSLGKILTISWTGGTPPFQASLLKTTGGSPLELFSRNSILVRTCSAPTSLLAIDNTYSAGVHHKLDTFTIRTGKNLSGMAISSASKVVLRFSTFSAFSVH